MGVGFGSILNHTRACDREKRELCSLGMQAWHSTTLSLAISMRIVLSVSISSITNKFFRSVVLYLYLHQLKSILSQISSVISEIGPTLLVANVRFNNDKLVIKINNSTSVIFKIFIILLSIPNKDKGGGLWQTLDINVKYYHIL